MPNEGRLDEMLATLLAEGIPSASILTKEQIESLLPLCDGAISFFKSVQETALNAALAGERFEGYKVVEGRTIRRYSDAEGVIRTATALGIDEAMLYKPRELIGVTDLKRLAKKDFVKFEPFIVSPPGKPALVPESDKRPEYVPSATSSALEDFKGDLI